MIFDQEMFETINKATEHLSTIRRPLPEHIDEDAVQESIQKLLPFLANPEVISELGGDADNVANMVILLVMEQRLLFNRTLWQMTVRSLADGILVGVSTVVPSDQALAQFVKLGHELCAYLSEQKLSLDGNQMAPRFLEAIRSKRPELIELMDQPDEKFEMMDPFFGDEDSFKNDPVVLVSKTQTPFFAQGTDSGVNFNEFIQKIAAKHSPAQLQLAYFLFEDKQYRYLDILEMAQNIEKQPHFSKTLEAQTFQKWGNILAFTDGLKADGLIHLSKVLHQFLKFCLNVQLMSHRIYTMLLRMANQVLIDRVVARTESDADFSTKRVQEKGLTIADQIFVNPNYTISGIKARTVLEGLDMTPVPFQGEHNKKPLALSKKLSAHQLELELDKAKTHLEAMMALLDEDQISKVDTELYQQEILTVHQEMVQTYNRRLRQWTEDSLQACLSKYFQTHRELDRKPTFFRFFFLYLLSLDDDNAIQSLEALAAGLSTAVQSYIVASVNAFS